MIFHSNQVKSGGFMSEYNLTMEIKKILSLRENPLEALVFSNLQKNILPVSLSVSALRFFYFFPYRFSVIKYTKSNIPFFFSVKVIDHRHQIVLVLAELTWL